MAKKASRSQGRAVCSRMGACPACATAITRSEVMRDGMIHSRSQALGGPFHTILCPGCQTRLAAEGSGGLLAFTSEESLPRTSAMRRALRFFLGMPRRAPPRAQDKSSRARARATESVSRDQRAPLGVRFKEELDTLGLSAATDLAGVKRRYRELAKKLHPDRFAHANPPEQERASRTFMKIKDAYERIVAQWPQDRT